MVVRQSDIKPAAFLMYKRLAKKIPTLGSNLVNQCDLTLGSLQNNLSSWKSTWVSAHSKHKDELKAYNLAFFSPLHKIR